MSVSDSLTFIEDVITRTYLKNNYSVEPCSIEAKHLIEIFNCYIEYDSKIITIVKKMNSVPYGSEDYNLYHTQLEEVIDERIVKVTKLFKDWINKEIIDIYTASKVMKMSEKYITHIPFVSFLVNLRTNLEAFTGSCVDSKICGYLKDFNEIFKIIGYCNQDYKAYIDKVIYEHFNV